MKEKGMALITILMMVIILVMLLTAMVGLNSNNLLYSRNYYERTAALSAAESGVAFALYALQEDPLWAPDTFEQETGAGKFIIQFYKPGYTPEFFSYNNLGCGTEGDAFDGTKVAPETVDLLVTGLSGNVRKIVRVILSRSVINDAGRCTGLVNVKADEFRILKTITPKDPTESGLFHSNCAGGPAGLQSEAIFIDPSTTVISNGGVISAVGDIAPVTTADTTIKPNSVPKNIPNIDISDIVTAAVGSNPNCQTGGTYKVSLDGSGQYKLFCDGSEISVPGMRIEEGTLIVSGDVAFTGDVEFIFDVPDSDIHNAGILLEKSGDFYPSIYIQSNNTKSESLNIYGKVEGNGSIYTTGETQFIMETNLVASEDPGVALLSEGDVKINLPSTHFNSVDLNMTGLVYSNGNIEADILSGALSTTVQTVSDWPENWRDLYTEAAFDPYSYFAINGMGPSFAINGWMAETGTWVRFDADLTGYGNIILDDEDNIIIEAAAGRTIDCKCSDMSVTGVLTFRVTDPPGIIRPDGSTNMTLATVPGVPSIVVGPLLYQFFSGYASSSGTRVEPPPEGTDKYAPDISLTGSLIVADPASATNPGAYNPDSGNLSINLEDSTLINKGNFTLKYSSNYEKLLGQSLLVDNLRTTCWEEIR